MKFCSSFECSFSLGDSFWRALAKCLELSLVKQSGKTFSSLDLLSGIEYPVKFDLFLSLGIFVFVTWMSRLVISFSLFKLPGIWLAPNGGNIGYPSSGLTANPGGLIDFSLLLFYSFRPGPVGFSSSFSFNCFSGRQLLVDLVVTVDTFVGCFFDRVALGLAIRIIRNHKLDT